MKFSGPLICGLILSSIRVKVTGSDEDEELSVIQSPSNISVNEGDSAQISCCWNQIILNVKIAWYINETKFPAVKQELQEQRTQNCSVLILTNILKNATGHYVCEVIQDIPFLKKTNGTSTVISVNDRLLEKKTVTVNVHTLFNPAIEKPDVPDHPKRNPEGSSRVVVIIYIFRSLPFICLLAAFFYLNRDDKRVTTSRLAVEHAVESGEGLDEDLEAGETQRNETEELKQNENVSEQEKERVNNEKPEKKVTAATEEGQDDKKQTVVIVNTEEGTSPMHSNENKTEQVLNNNENTHLIAGIEEGTVSVLGDLVSVL